MRLSIPSCRSRRVTIRGLSRPGVRADVRVVERALVCGVLAALLVWLPLQTPFAIAAFQYGGLSPANSRLILLLKDLVVAVLLAALLLRYARSIAWKWFDVVAVVYCVIVAVYSVLPWLLGSELPLLSVAASARLLVMPVELYALGRFASFIGVPTATLLQVFLGASAIAALLTVGLYVFVPVTFWSSVLDLPSFIREVQGFGGARTLFDISILGNYGIGTGGTIPRAVGPFTHPVGTGHYFVAPLLLSVAATFAAAADRERERMFRHLLATVLFTAAVIVPISRGSWLAAGLGVLILGALYRRLPITIAALALVSIFLLTVPPFSYSVQSALSLQDTSVVGHGEAIAEGIQTAEENPFGLGVGSGDHPGVAYAGQAAETEVTENTYLTILLSVGPLGLLAFLVWFVALALGLAPRGRRARSGDWMAMGLFAALMGFAVSGLTASPLMRFTTSASFWLLAGLVMDPERPAALLAGLRGFVGERRARLRRSRRDSPRLPA